MKPKEIQELLDFISSSGLAEVNIETEQFKISVKRNSDVPTRMVELPMTQQSNANITTSAVSSQLTQSLSIPSESAREVNEPVLATNPNHVTIKSPMIGTFYKSSSPETPSFVTEGQEIKVGQPVCIIEAMKLFNEIEAEISGKIIKILVDNATPVEYDQPLFIVESL